MKIATKFVDRIPAHLDDQVLYICEEFETAAHRCFCGCGEKVVTPLTPTDWKLHRSIGGVSLYPSIGNWALQCRSHYWIRDDQVHWSTEEWTQEEIDAGRARDRAAKERYYGDVPGKESFKESRPTTTDAPASRAMSTSMWLRLRRLWRG